MVQELKKLDQYKRIVVKIGSALLVDRKHGLKVEWLESLINDVAGLEKKGVEILLVSSGAIALGRTLLKLPSGSLKLEQSQACAAIGQIELAKAYGAALLHHGLMTGQILLTLVDTEERRHYLNARATINTLLNLGAVPVVNENDTVATGEIRYGDNDIRAINPAIEKMAGQAASELSRGGMKTKLEAGKIANQSGTAMIITSGKRLNPLAAIDRGERASFFAASEKPVSAWKTWISGQLDPSGTLTIDEGAVRALKRGKSLLAAGVIALEGNFHHGDTVAIVDKDNLEIARGLVSYDREEADRIIGLKNSEIETILGYEPRSAMVHRNDMVLRN